MSHISYSELKDWNFCSYYHKLTRVEGIDGFKGNEYQIIKNRKEAIEFALQKMNESGLNLDGGIMASDAFFPFLIVLN